MTSRSLSLSDPEISSRVRPPEPIGNKSDIILDIADIGKAQLPAEMGDAIPKFDCGICLTAQALSENIEFNGKTHGICKSCFGTFLLTEINLAKVENIQCPHCDCALSDEQIKSLVPTILYTKYQRYLLNLAVMRDPHSRWCATPECETILKLDSIDQKEICCSKCNFTMCLRCNRRQHPETTCENLNSRDMTDWASQRNVSKCPTCRMVVEKIDGCNHMTCTICSYEFCWLCEAAYTPYHYKPWNPLGCPNMQSGESSQRLTATRRNLAIFCRLLWLILTFPFMLLFGFPARFTIRVMRRTQRRRCCCQFLKGFFAFLLGMMLNVLFVPLMFLYLIPASIYHLAVYIKLRLRLYQRSREKLERHKALLDSLKAAHTHRPEIASR